MEKDKDLRYILRLPRSLAHEIDGLGKNRLPSVTRNQWILEAIYNYIDKSKKETTNGHVWE